MRTLAVLLAFLSAWASWLPCQSGGPLMGFPAHIMLAQGSFAAGGTTPLPVRDAYAKKAGFQPVLAVTTVAAGAPDFTAAAMFGPPGGGLPAFRVNALSIGQDYVFADANLRLPDVISGRWGALLYSVSRNSPGVAGTAVAVEAARADGPGADLFSWIYPGSDPSLLLCFTSAIGVVQRATDSTQMDLWNGTNRSEIDAVDPFMQMYELGIATIAGLPSEPWLYFSVPYVAIHPPGGGASTVPAIWFGGSTPSSATVLKRRWLLTPTPHWGPVQVHLTYLQLGLTEFDDIDALAVDEDAGLMLFSLTPTPMQPVVSPGQQLMIACWTCGPDGPVRAETYKKLDGTEVAGETGQGSTGEIDATCSVDPALFAQSMPSPAGCPPGFGITLTQSLFRTCPSSSSVGSIATTVGSLPATGTSAIVVLLVGLPGPGGSLTQNPFTESLFLLPADGQGGGRAIRYLFEKPFLTQTYGVPLDFLWAALVQGSIEFSPGMRIRV